MCVDAEICVTTTSIVATEAIVPRGGGRWPVSDRTKSSRHGRGDGHSLPTVSIAGINSAERAEPRHGIRGKEVCELPTLRGGREVHHGHGHKRNNN